MHIPEARADRLGEVAEGRERAVRLEPERQCGERPGRRAVDGPGAVEDVELRLMARTDEDVLARSIEADRAPGVGADLRERDELRRGRRTGRSGARGATRVRSDPDQERRRVRIGAVAIREDGQHPADRHVRGDDRGSAVGRQSPPGAPAGLEQASTGRRTEREDRDRQGGSE